MTNDRISSQREITLESTPTDAAASGGVTRRDVLALLAALGVPSTALAQDPVKTMPKNYRVAFENDMVRVLEYNNRPGMGPCGTGLHYHPRHIDIFLTSFRGQAKEDGKRFAAAGVLERHIRLPFTLAPWELERAVEILAELTPGRVDGKATRSLAGYVA